MPDENVVHFFCDILKANKSVHYLELIKRLECSETDEQSFFDSYTDFRRRWFFKRRLQFSIGNDGYVSLNKKVEKPDSPHTQIDEDTEEETSNIEISYCGSNHDEQLLGSNSSIQKAIIDSLIGTLLQHGMMHYLALTKCPSMNENCNVEKFFALFSSPEKFIFFKNRSNEFSINTEGYVTLSDLKLERFDEEKKKKEKKVINYFISVLRISREMSHRKLVKSLQASNLDIRNYFDSYSTTGLRKFFKKHSSIFQFEFNPIVSLQGRANKSITCVSQEKVNTPDNAPIKGRKGDENQVCGRRYDSRTVAENIIAKLLISTLSEYGTMHYNALVKFIASRAETEHLKKMTSPEHVTFLRGHSDIIKISSNGRVSLTKEALVEFNRGREREKKVIEFFVSVLEKCHKMPRSQLVRRLQSSKLDVKNYFDLFTKYEIKMFFKTHKSLFAKEKGIYVLLQKETSEQNLPSDNMSQTRKAENAQTEKINDVAERGQCGLSSPSSALVNPIEKDVVEILVAALLEYGSMHYAVLIKCASCKRNKKYFEQLSLSKNDMFFRKHSDTFTIRDDGIVTLTDMVLNGTKPKETQVVDYFVSVLENATIMNPFTLIRRLKKSEVNVKDYFDTFNTTDIYDFFENHPSTFLLQNEIIVSLKNKGNEIPQESYKTNYDPRSYNVGNYDYPVWNYGNLDGSYANLAENYANPAGYCAYNVGYCASNSDSNIAWVVTPHTSNRASCSDVAAERTVIETLVSNLLKHGRMYFYALTQSLEKSTDRNVSTYFRRINKRKQFKFFKGLPQFFNINGDGYVTVKPSFLKRSEEELNLYYPTCYSNYNSCMRIPDQYGGQHQHQTDMCNSTDESKATSLYAGVMPKQFMPDNSELKIAVQGPKGGTRQNVPDVGTIGNILVIKNEGISDVLYTNDPHPLTSRTNNSNYMDEMSLLCDKARNSAGSAYLKKNAQVLSLTEFHMQSIRYFVILLKNKNKTHYRKLLQKVCAYDNYTCEFFSYFSLEDVLEFIQMHSMYFSLQDDESVTLVDSSVTSDRVFASEDDVHEVASIMEAKSVEFFVKILQQRKRSLLSEFECHLGFAPGYVLSFFVANYFGEDFLKFFQQRSIYFHVHPDGHVELSL